MEIKWLKTFIVAASYENFRRTSEELFLTQPAITKHIHRLEENLNSKLFERKGKLIILTPAGHRFLPTAKEIVKKYEDGLETFESWKQGYEQKITITAAPQIASSILPSILRKFIEKYPRIEVLINILPSYEIGEEIYSGRADIGLSRIRPIQSKVHCKTVHEDPVILVGPAKENNMDNNEKNVLQKYRLITHNHPEYWDELLKTIKNIYPSVRTMKVNQIEITKRFIEQGLGISYLPVSMIMEELMLKKLAEIKADKISLPTSSTYVITKLQTNEVLIFSKFLEEEMAAL
ncbi:transcriptional regulator [Bacillus sp. SA1-12]|uniref:LysR family transcriptional regulator n=1 Tax=Bacillus sp. SA1-12 TaxID=1455638 RepID=UPI000626394C|nr:LysR family transcriptional regulator [Bacillus sp. SA1-12]KKI91978.1 transcriptional regulator [Bacillus sp. SA1-12]